METRASSDAPKSTRPESGLSARTETGARPRQRSLGRLHSSALRLIAASAFVALLTLAPAAQGRGTAGTQTLQVNFFVTGTIAVTLSDGTPVGATSGAPTVIPAGYYKVLLFGPGGCANVPYFDLKGPGTNIVDNMDGGELATNYHDAYFVPNSTYTWRNDDTPGVVYAFQTSSDVQGTPPPAVGPKGIAASNHGTAVSQNLIGSAIVPSRAALTGAVSAAGRLTLAYKGKSVTTLAAGRYTFTVTDKSTTSGFMLEKTKHALVSVTGLKFVGKHSVKVNLTAGRWFLTPRAGQKTLSIAVS